MSFFKRLFKAGDKSSLPSAGAVVLGDVIISELQRPTDTAVAWSAIQGAIRMPMIPLPFRFLYDIAMNVDYIRMVILKLVEETFRNGLRIVPAFVLKCTVCGAEYQEVVSECRVCGSKRFIVPSEENRQWLEKFIHDVNLNDETLIDVLRALDFDVNVLDNAFLVVIKDYVVRDGNIVGAVVREVVRADPRWMTFIMSQDGRFARTDEGKALVFCVRHRSRLHQVDPSEVGKATCPQCGLAMVPAYFKYGRLGGQETYFTDGEVLHIKKFTFGIGYGYSPLMSLIMKILILWKQDWFMVMAYHLQRPPRGMLIIKGVSRESFEKAWAMMQEMARLNPNLIHPLVIEGSADRAVAEYVDLSYRPEEFEFTEFRDEVRRTIAAFYGVTPIFVGEVSGRGESMQVLVTNRAVEVEQRMFNEHVLPWLMRQLGVSDWRVVLAPSEMRDELRHLEIIERKLEIAAKLKELGYGVKVVQRHPGEIDIEIVPEAVKGAQTVGEPISSATPFMDLEARRRRYYAERETAGFEGSVPIERPRVGRAQGLEGEPLSRRHPETEPEGAPS
ncbi:MAG: phage portal protein [Nanopusillaceae archaeon]